MRPTNLISILVMVLLSSSFATLMAGGWADTITWKDIEFTNETNHVEDYYIEFNRWAYVDFFYQIDEGDTLHKRSGRLVPFHQRDVPFDGQVIIGIQLEPGQTAKGIARLEMEAYAGPPPSNRPVPIMVREDAVKEMWGFHTFHLSVIGLLTFLLIYNSILFISTKFKRYRFYLLGVLAMILETAREGGLLIPLFGGWESYPLYENYLAIFFNFAQILVCPYVVRDLLDIPQNYPKIEKLYRYYFLICIGGLILSYIDFEAIYSIAFWHLAIVISAIFILITAHAIKGFPHSRVLFIGIAIFLIFSIIHWFGNFGTVYISDNYISPLRSVGTIVLDTFLSIVLASMVWNLRKNNAALQSRIIENLQREKLNQKRMAFEIANGRERVRKTYAKRLAKEVESPLKKIKAKLNSIDKQPEPNSESISMFWEEPLRETQKIIGNAHEISNELLPFDLIGSDGLSNAVEEYLSTLRIKNLRIQFAPFDSSGLALSVRTLSYRIIRHLVSWSIKEAAADEIKIELSHSNNMLLINVEDNGKENSGPKSMESNPRLDTIRGNVSLFSGRVWYDPSSGLGTSILVQIPTNSFAEL